MKLKEDGPATSPRLQLLASDVAFADKSELRRNR